MHPFILTILTLNLGFGLAASLFLWQFRRSIKREIGEHADSFKPVFTEQVSNLVYRGLVLWSCSFVVAYLRAAPFFRDLELALFTAGMMYVTHGLTHLTAYPIRDGGIPPKLQRFETLRTVSLGVLISATCLILIADLAREPTAGEGWSLSFMYPLWVLIINLHTWWSLRFSENRLRRTVVVMLALGGLYALSLLLSNRGITILLTAMLVSLLSVLYRSAQLHIEAAFKKTDFARREKDVVVSFLTTIAKDEGHHRGDEPTQSLVGTLDLDFLLRTTLKFGMELTEAGAGAIFMFEPTEENGRLAWQRDALIPRAVDGLYPPRTDIAHLPHVSMRQKYLNDLLLSERLPVGQGLEGLVTERGESVLITNGLDDPRVLQQQEDFLKVRTGLAVPLKFRDDVVGVISVVNRKGDKPFTEEDVTLLEAMSEQAAITFGTAVMHQELQEKQLLEREIELAHEVQRLLLPTSCPQPTGYAIAAFNESAQQVGGDYFDFITHPSGEITTVIADVSGKGVPAALTMALVRSALRALGPAAKGPKELLVKINRFISEDLRRDMFISMMAVTLDPTRKRLRVARAGHDPLIQLRADNEGRPKQFSPAGIALGLVRNEGFETYTTEIEIDVTFGERYVLYTDGVTEAMNEEGEEYSLESLLDALTETRQETPEEAIESIRRRVSDFVQSAPQHDDFTLLLLDVLPEKDRDEDPVSPPKSVTD